MKKTTAFLGALLLSSAFVAPVRAADTQEITTTDGTKTQEGTVYGSLSGTALKQLKVTVPIKLDFAVAPVTTMTDSAAPAAANMVYNGDYKIKVASDSEIGVQLDNINLKEIGAWKLDTAAKVAALNLTETASKADPTKAKTIALNIAGKEMAVGDNAFAEDEYKVAISGDKSLGLSGTAGKVWLDKNLAASAEQAFTITYTISQK